MDIKTISVAFVAIMVGAVAFGAMLPIFQDVTATEDTYDNTTNAIGYYNKLDLTGDNTVTFVWDHTKPTKVTVNDNEFDLPDVSSYPNGVSLIVSEGLAIRYYVQSGARYFIQSIGGNTTAGAWGYGSSQGSTDVTITLDSSGWTYNNSTYTLTGDTYIISQKGDYVMKNPNTKAYLLDDSSTGALGITVISGVWVIMGWNSNSGANITPVEYYPPDGYTITNVVVNSSAVDSHVGLSTLDKVTFTATNVEDTSVHSDVTYSYFIVPASVTAERVTHGDDGFNTIVNLIPLVIGMGLLLIAVWWFVVRKF